MLQNNHSTKEAIQVQLLSKTLMCHRNENVILLQIEERCINLNFRTFLGRTKSFDYNFNLSEKAIKASSKRFDY